MRIKISGWTLSLFVFGLLVPPAFGTSVRVVNLSDMVQLSDRVFYGQCLSVEDDQDLNFGFSVKVYRFQVIRALKGVEAGSEVTFRQLFGGPGGGLAIAGIPHYREGQKILLFLHGDSKGGMTSPVGMGQGTFLPSRLENGDIGFMNPVRNRNLMYQLEQRVVEEAGFGAEQTRQMESAKPIPLDLMAEMVERMDLYQQRRSTR
jgi:hypothetical protein